MVRSELGAFARLGAVACALVGSMALSSVTAAQEASGQTFEALAAEASAVDVATLLVPYLDECKAERREIDRARCRGARSSCSAREALIEIELEPSPLPLSLVPGRGV